MELYSAGGTSRTAAVVGTARSNTSLMHMELHGNTQQCLSMSAQGGLACWPSRLGTLPPARLARQEGREAKADRGREGSTTQWARPSASPKPTSRTECACHLLCYTGAKQPVGHRETLASMKLTQKLSSVHKLPAGKGRCVGDHVHTLELKERCDKRRTATNTSPSSRTPLSDRTLEQPALGLSTRRPATPHLCQCQS